MGLLEIRVGVLGFGDVRDYLKRAKFMGENIEWIESSGWIFRTFTVRGPDQAIHKIKTDIQAWHDETMSVKDELR